MPHLADAVFIALSGYGQEQDRQRSLEAGFDRHLVKPVDTGELMQALAAGSPGMRARAISDGATNEQHKQAGSGRAE
jgi:CheY-like chemotaxis protein